MLVQAHRLETSSALNDKPLVVSATTDRDSTTRRGVVDCPTDIRQLPLAVLPPRVALLPPFYSSNWGCQVRTE